MCLVCGRLSGHSNYVDDGKMDGPIHCWQIKCGFSVMCLTGFNVVVVVVVVCYCL